MSALGSGVGTVSPVYLGVLILELVTSLLVVAGVGLLYLRRRSLPYLLIFVGFLTLVVRSLIGFIGVFSVGLFAVEAFTLHNTVEHGLDILLVGCLLLAVYLATDMRQEATDE